MGFLNSTLLWSGLAAAGVAVPIVIHLLYRKHRRQTDWAAMELLRRALVVRSGQVKFEDYLILFLRCLALLLIAAALLRPTLHSHSVQWLGEKRVGIVVAIDASYSMNHGEFSRFERAIGKAKEVLETAQPGEPVTLVLMSNHPQILLRAAAYDPTVFDDLLDEQKAATPYRLSLERNLEQLEQLIAELKAPARECYLITDGQELDWGKLSNDSQATLTRLTNKASVFMVPVEAGGENNLSLTELTYVSGPLQRAGVVRFLAVVRNEGPNLTRGGNVEFYVGKDMITRHAVGPLEPGQARGVSFITSFETTGDVRLRAHLAKDELIEDNDRYAVVNIRPSINVLCVDDKQPSDGAESRTGAYYAVRAIRLLDRDADGPLHVDQVSAADMSLQDLSDYDVILMANVADLAPEMIERIKRFVRGGGGLILFLGDQVKAKLYNEGFGSGAEGLLPAKLGKVLSVGEGEGGWSLAPIRSQHSLAEIVKRLGKSRTDTARFFKVMQVTPAPDSQTILTIAQPNAPLLLSRDVGDGSVLMFTTSADRAWNELAVHPLYTLLIKQAITNMTSRPNARQVIVGESVELAVRGRKVGDRIQVTDPQGLATDLKVTQSGKRSVCAIETDQVGVYEVAGDKDEALTVAVNVDPAESNVRVVDAAALADKLEPLGVRVVLQADALADAIEEGRQGRELASFLLVCGLVVFVLQGLLAKYFTSRMSRPETDVAASLQMSRVSAARRS